MEKEGLKFIKIMLGTFTKDGKFICKLHSGKGEVRIYKEVHDDTECSICHLVISKSGVELPKEISDKGIIAWRGWRLDIARGSSDLYLHSLVMETVWNPCNMLVAEGNEGIYAVKRDCIAIALSYSPIVIGQVYLTGEIVEYTAGYRGELAYPKSLFVRSSLMEPDMESLLRYKVPVFNQSECTFEEFMEIMEDEKCT